jgi:hypothetical protein
MRKGCKHNEGTSALPDLKSLIFESEYAVKQIRKTIRYSGKQITHPTYYLNKTQQTNCRNNNHLINQEKQKVEECDLVWEICST